MVVPDFGRGMVAAVVGPSLARPQPLPLAPQQRSPPPLPRRPLGDGGATFDSSTLRTFSTIQTACLVGAVSSQDGQRVRVSKRPQQGKASVMRWVSCVRTRLMQTLLPVASCRACKPHVI